MSKEKIISLLETAGKNEVNNEQKVIYDTNKQFMTLALSSMGFMFASMIVLAVVALN